MTNYNKQTLATFFQNGDVPTGTDYENLIDSNLNLVETSAQSMAGPLVTTELITNRVSATNVNVTGTFSVNSFSPTSLSVANDVSAGGTIYASASRTPINFHGNPLIVSALGSTQTTAAPLTVEFCRLQGAADGQTTGFTLLANKQGWVQYLANECTVSANLWPPVGGIINGLSTNVPFPMVASTPYIVMHRNASAYSVK